MSDNDQLDIRRLISSAASHVFGTMLSMKIRDSAVPEAPQTNGERVVASVGFGGTGVAGGLAINVTSQFASTITATMLGLNPDEAGDPADVSDVMGELANVIGGNCLAALSEQGHQCALSLPSVIRGAEFKTETIRGAKRESVSFEHGLNRFLITLDLKAASR